MANNALDVVGIGNAIVDVLAHSEDAFLEQHGLPKGGMTLIEADQAETLYGQMGPGTEMSGGSAANTMAGLASLGGSGAFFGRVRDDQLGQVFRHDIRATGIEFDCDPATDGPSTARCLILITPDAQRTMNTFLGASVEFGPEDLDPKTIARGKVTYLEGYLYDRPKAKDAFLVAADAAHKAGNRVSLTLSDPFCVDRHRADFRSLVEGHIDVLFANEAEITSLYETEDFDEALRHVRGQCEIAVLTRSEKGAVIVSGDEVHTVAAEPVDKVVDTTGAGDQYAAGFLYGLTQGHPLPVCGRIGAIAAAEIISHVGARPEVALKELVARKLG